MSLVRRLSVLTILIAAFGCLSSTPLQTSVNICQGGFLGNNDPTAPLVCVGVQGSSATPLIDPVHVYTK